MFEAQRPFFTVERFARAIFDSPYAGLAYQGFNDIEDQVVDAAAKFILSH